MILADCSRQHNVIDYSLYRLVSGAILAVFLYRCCLESQANDLDHPQEMGQLLAQRNEEMAHLWTLLLHWEDL